MGFTTAEYMATLPLLCLVALSLIVLMLQFAKHADAVTHYVTLVGLMMCLAVSVIQYRSTGLVFFEMLRIDTFSNFFGCLFFVTAILTVLISRSYLIREDINHGEFYVLVLLAVIGMVLLAAAADLIMIFLGIELMSLCLYVLAGFKRTKQKSNEAALKYFLLGAFATGFLLYGISFLYGVSGTTNIEIIVAGAADLSRSWMFWVGVGLTLVGLAFKAAAVPFHMWVPDVYEGAPTASTMFMSTGSKAAAFAALFVVIGRIVQLDSRLTEVIALLSAASMIVGNVIAISQSNLKRMLAYSSIAHAGYILTGLAAGNELGRQGMMYYLAVYVLMNIGAFGILMSLEREQDKNLTYDEYSGLAKTNPFVAALMAVFMFSLAGIPPFGGFFAKYYVFAAAVNAHLTWLAVIGVLTSLVSVYYYLRLVVVMYFREGDNIPSERFSPSSMFAVTASALGVVVLGILPSVLLSLVF